jgi:hypothetical protein
MGGVDLAEFASLEAISAEHFHEHFDPNVLGLLLTTQEDVKHRSAESVDRRTFFAPQQNCEPSSFALSHALA